MVLQSSMWFLVFFFKQKTAYEMRISDWSSDVCSSDLTTPLQAAKNAYSMANYARTTALKADSIFGPTTIADEQIAFSNQIRDISNKIRTATQNGASDVEIGVLNQQLMKARDSFNAAVQAKVTRLVGNDKEGDRK